MPGDSGSPCIIKHGNSIYAVAMIVAGSTGSLWSRRNEGREVPEGIVLERDILEKVTAAFEYRVAGFKVVTDDEDIRSKVRRFFKNMLQKEGLGSGGIKGVFSVSATGALDPAVGVVEARDGGEETLITVLPEGLIPDRGVEAIAHLKNVPVELSITSCGDFDRIGVRVVDVFRQKGPGSKDSGVELSDGGEENLIPYSDLTVSPEEAERMVTEAIAKYEELKEGFLQEFIERGQSEEPSAPKTEEEKVEEYEQRVHPFMLSAFRAIGGLYASGKTATADQLIDKINREVHGSLMFGQSLNIALVMRDEVIMLCHHGKTEKIEKASGRYLPFGGTHISQDITAYAFPVLQKHLVQSGNVEGLFWLAGYSRQVVESILGELCASGISQGASEGVKELIAGFKEAKMIFSQKAAEFEEHVKALEPLSAKMAMLAQFSNDLSESHFSEGNGDIEDDIYAIGNAVGKLCREAKDDEELAGKFTSFSGKAKKSGLLFELLMEMEAEARHKKAIDEMIYDEDTGFDDFSGYIDAAYAKLESVKGLVENLHERNVSGSLVDHNLIGRAFDAAESVKQFEAYTSVVESNAERIASLMDILTRHEFDEDFLRKKVISQVFVVLKEREGFKSGIDLVIEKAEVAKPILDILFKRGIGKDLVQKHILSRLFDESETLESFTAYLAVLRKRVDSAAPLVKELKEYGIGESLILESVITRIFDPTDPLDKLTADVSVLRAKGAAASPLIAALKAAGVGWRSIEAKVTRRVFDYAETAQDYARHISALTRLMEISGVLLKTLREYTIDEKLIEENIESMIFDPGQSSQKLLVLVEKLQKRVEVIGPVIKVIVDNKINEGIAARSPSKLLFSWSETDELFAEYAAVLRERVEAAAALVKKLQGYGIDKELIESRIVKKIFEETPPLEDFKSYIELVSQKAEIGGPAEQSLRGHGASGDLLYRLLGVRLFEPEPLEEFRAYVSDFSVNLTRLYEGFENSGQEKGYASRAISLLMNKVDNILDFCRRHVGGTFFAENKEVYEGFAAIGLDVQKLTDPEKTKKEYRQSGEGVKELEEGAGYKEQVLEFLKSLENINLYKTLFEQGKEEELKRAEDRSQKAADEIKQYASAKNIPPKELVAEKMSAKNDIERLRREATIVSRDDFKKRYLSPLREWLYNGDVDKSDILSVLDVFKAEYLNMENRKSSEKLLRAITALENSLPEESTFIGVVIGRLWSRSVFYDLLSSAIACCFLGGIHEWAGPKFIDNAAVLMRDYYTEGKLEVRAICGIFRECLLELGSITAQAMGNKQEDIVYFLGEEFDIEAEKIRGTARVAEDGSVHFENGSQEITVRYDEEKREFVVSFKEGEKITEHTYEVEGERVYSKGAVLMVDAVEGSGKIKPELINEDIQKFAKNCGFRKVAFSTSPTNHNPRNFLRVCYGDKEPEELDVQLAHIQGREDFDTFRGGKPEGRIHAYAVHTDEVSGNGDNNRKGNKDGGSIGRLPKVVKSGVGLSVEFVMHVLPRNISIIAPVIFLPISSWCVFNYPEKNIVSILLVPLCLFCILRFVYSHYKSKPRLTNVRRISGKCGLVHSPPPEEVEAKAVTAANLFQDQKGAGKDGGERQDEKGYRFIASVDLKGGIRHLNQGIYGFARFKGFINMLNAAEGPGNKSGATDGGSLILGGSEALHRLLRDTLPALEREVRSLQAEIRNLRQIKLWIECEQANDEYWSLIIMEADPESAWERDYKREIEFENRLDYLSEAIEFLERKLRRKKEEIRQARSNIESLRVMDELLTICDSQLWPVNNSQDGGEQFFPLIFSNSRFAERRTTHRIGEIAGGHLDMPASRSNSGIEEKFLFAISLLPNAPPDCAICVTPGIRTPPLKKPGTSTTYLSRTYVAHSTLNIELHEALFDLKQLAVLTGISGKNKETLLFDFSITVLFYSLLALSGDSGLRKEFFRAVRANKSFLKAFLTGTEKSMTRQTS
ncbi:MAG: hypothetical protein PHE11_04405, partial [Candidatus Omnitrophica bacterium]|nr:hypothetical protein [Candidatus Omnitrophota bacterium]